MIGVPLAEASPNFPMLSELNMAKSEKPAINAEYLRYVERTASLIRDTLDNLQCQPIFFIGSGLPKRYFGSPGWIDLLRSVAKKTGIEDAEFNYLLQKYEVGHGIALSLEISCGTLRRSQCLIQSQQCLELVLRCNAELDDLVRRF
jgi:hypothetical protein